MDQQEYDDLETKDPNIYYMTHGTESDNGGVASSEFLETNYYNQEQIVDLFNSALQNLFNVSGTVLELGTHALDIILVDKPTDQTFDYDGNIHKLESTDYYNVIGDGGSEPGTYRFKVVLKAGKRWKDNTNTPIFITYTINQNTK